MHKEFVIQSKINNRKKIVQEAWTDVFLPKYLKNRLASMPKKTPFMCIQRYKTRKTGQVWGIGGASSLHFAAAATESSLHHFYLEL